MNVLSIQSHVSFGHAGNSAAVFAMQRLGVNVWPIHTVQFSNHTQYGHWQGATVDGQVLENIVQGIADIGELANCDAIISGYLGSAEQAQHISNIVSKVKAANPRAIYLCDPVMGHTQKGCVVAPGVERYLLEKMPAIADIMTPNQLELESLSGMSINTVDEAVLACRKLISLGPKIVMVKYINARDKPREQFGMIVVSADEAWYGCRPLYPFTRQPVGAGDLTSGIFLAQLLKGDSLCNAFKHTLAAVDAVMARTYQDGSYELQIIAAQNEMVDTLHKFPVINLLLRPASCPANHYNVIWC